MKKQEAIINFDDMNAKRQFIVFAGSLRGQVRVEFIPYRPRRSDRQLRYYWPCVVVPFAHWLHDENGEKYDEQAAHEILKAEYLTIQVVNKETGERLGSYVGSTGDLDRPGFWDYVEKCRDHLAKYCHIVTQDPDRNNASVAPKRASAA